MGQPYVGEIRLFGGDFAPSGWMKCEGQVLPISENDILFTLIGTTYGGDGQETFALPDLRSRIPNHMGQGPGLQNYSLGEKAGVEQVTLTTQQIPQHSHPFVANTGPGHVSQPQGAYPAAHRDYRTFVTDVAPADAMGASAIVSTGGSQPHENMPPYLGLTFIISLFGVFPSPSGSGDAEPFMGELRIFSFGFAPRGWALCNGQILAINQNQALFALLGTTYGGNGQTTFALPDLRGRGPAHYGSTFSIGSRGGEEVHTLSTAEMPQHAHAARGVNKPGTSTAPAASFPAAHRGGYSDSFSTSMHPSTIGATGGSQAHENRAPYITLNFCIATAGIFPSTGGNPNEDAFLAEIRINAFNFAPSGFAKCEGQILPISQNTALFSLLLTYYGGNGQNTFALPDLNARFPVHGSQDNAPGLSARFLGEMGGESVITLIESELPAHSHALASVNTGGTPVREPSPLTAIAASVVKAFHAGPADTTLASDVANYSGSGFAHNNMPPYLALNFCIAIAGIFPPRG